MTKLTTIMMIAAIALLAQSCGTVLTTASNATGSDSTNNFGSSPVGSDNTPGTFRTGNYGQSSMALEATANTTGPTPSARDMADYKGNRNHTVAAVSSNTWKFIKQAGLTGISELKMSQIAVNRAKNPQIKQHAAAIVANYSTEEKELSALADSRQVALSDIYDSGIIDINAKTLKLTNISDDAFDREYLKMISKDHKDAVNVLQQGSKFSDPAVKAFAAKFLPVYKGFEKNVKGL